MLKRVAAWAEMLFRNAVSASNVKARPFVREPTSNACGLGSCLVLKLRQLVVCALRRETVVPVQSRVLPRQNTSNLSSSALREASRWPDPDPRLLSAPRRRQRGLQMIPCRSRPPETWGDVSFTDGDGRGGGR